MSRQSTIWYDENSHVIIISGLTDVVSGIEGAADPFVNDATVQLVDIVDESGESVLVSTIDGAYVDDSDGVYVIEIPHDVADLSPNILYTFYVRAVASSGSRGEWRIPVTVEERRGTAGVPTLPPIGGFNSIDSMSVE